MSFLLDTSVLSQLEKLRPDEAVVRWWQKQDATEFYLSVVVIQELRYGIELLPTGKRKRELEGWLQHGFLSRFHGHILAVDESIADLSGKLLAAAKKAGHTAELADSLIPATARIHGLNLVTLNRRHFERLGVAVAQL